MQENKPVNRRAVLAGAAALPVLFGARPAPAADQGTDPGLKPSVLATRISRHHHMMLPVMVNGAGPFHFVIDTGADHSVISDRLAAQLQLASGHEMRVEGVVRAVRVCCAEIDTLRFGDFQARHLRLPVLPERWLGADGFLGLDLISNHRVTLDFIRHRFRVEPGLSRFSTLHIGPRVAVISADDGGGARASGLCQVNGVRCRFFLDTGGEISVGNPALLAAMLARDRSGGLSVGRVVIHGVTGGELLCRTVALRKLKMQALRFTDGMIGIADLHIFDVRGLKKSPALLIGMNFLSQFETVSIDYRRKIYTFRLPA